MTLDDEQPVELVADDGVEDVGGPINRQQPGIASEADGPYGRGGGCLYRATDNSVEAATFVSIGLLGTTATRAQFDEEVTKLGGGQQVDGVGDIAMFFPSGGLLVVLDGGTWLHVQMDIDSQVSQDIGLLTKLATSVLGRV